MCKLGGGANRCDAHWGSTQKAADLARRRAKYAAKKGGEVRAYTKQDAQAVLADNPQISTEGFKIKAVAENNRVIADTESEQLKKLRATGEQSHHEKLGLHSASLEGSYTESGYYAKETLEGTVNWNNLDENSYQSFGFQPISEPRGIFNIKAADIHRSSEHEFTDITQEEAAAIRIFTSSSYSWINECLYNKSPQVNLFEEDEEDGNIRELGEGLYSGNSLSDEEMTVTNLKNIVSHIDSGLEKAPHQQRIVYRGFNEESFLSGKEEKSVGEAFANLELGQEMVFDGYQSTSYSPHTAAAYGAVGSGSSYDGVLLEIRTSSGANVLSKTHFQSEKEVLLPRNARYMVVGKHSAVDLQLADSAHNYIDSEPQLRRNCYVLQLVEITENGDIASAENRPAPPPALTSVQTAGE